MEPGLFFSDFMALQAGIFSLLSLAVNVIDLIVKLDRKKRAGILHNICFLYITFSVLDMQAELIVRPGIKTLLTECIYTAVAALGMMALNIDYYWEANKALYKFWNLFLVALCILAFFVKRGLFNL